ESVLPSFHSYSSLLLGSYMHNTVGVVHTNIFRPFPLNLHRELICPAIEDFIPYVIWLEVAMTLQNTYIDTCVMATRNTQWVALGNCILNFLQHIISPSI